MAKTDLNIPLLGSKFVDLRDPIPGDSYNWSWVRPLSQVKFLAIHHTAGPDTQTPTEIANFHINSNGWGGIGYHFLIDKNGTVYYVGDISTARANVANLNDQVLGICLIGSFISGKEPTSAQLDSAHKLCDFFINNYPDLTNLSSWDQVRGHKELPGQSTTCPGDNWPGWRPRLVDDVQVTPSPTPPSPTPSPINPPAFRGAQISEAYRVVLGRDPDMGGLQTYTNSNLTIDQIIKSMTESGEHRELIRMAKDAASLKSQIQSLQTSLGSINQQVISLQETLQTREREIAQLKRALEDNRVVVPPVVVTPPTEKPKPVTPPDNTMTIVGAFIELYKFIFQPRKESPA